MKSLEVS